MTPQEAAEQYANEHWGDNYITENKAHDEKAFIAGQQWQSEQDNQALSSALKEIAKLTSWKNEMLQLWNKLDAYIETRKDIRPGEYKVDFAIKIMKERDELHAKVKEFEKLISSDSVWTLLRYGYKSPSSSGVDDCEDDNYMDLYKLSTDLKQANRLASESNPEPDSANLPPESAS